MEHAHDVLTIELKKRGLRLSRRRLRVLDYLCQNPNHPTAEQIFQALQSEFPGLSITTVYSTLHLLEDIGLVRIVGIEDNETRYDIITKSHGHFKCEECGAILDFCFDLDAIAAKELEGFFIADRNLYFKGLCPKCLENRNKK
jgi:Fe2+ or Zn2+ uptake regulation protein